MISKHTIGAALAASLAFASVGAQARGFTPSDAYLAYLKLAAPDDLSSYVPEYRSHFAPPIVRQATEFDPGNENARLLATLTRNVAKFDLADAFEIPLAFHFGDYDFSKKAFNFHPLTAATTFNAGSIAVVFTNTRGFDGLAMEPDAAKAFLDRHPFRDVAATVTFVPVEAVEDTNRIKARIVEIEVFADPQRQNLIADMRPPQGQ